MIVDIKKQSNQDGNDDFKPVALRTANGGVDSSMIVDSFLWLK